MTEQTYDLLAFIDQTLYANADHDAEIKWANQEVLDLLADIRTKVVATVGPQPLVVTTLEELCEALETQGDGQLVLSCSVGGLWAVTSDEDGDYIYQHVFGDDWSEISDFFTTHILPAEVLTRISDAAGSDSGDKSTDTPGASARGGTVEVDSDDLRKWANFHADAGHHGVAHVLFQAAKGIESITQQHNRETAAKALEEAANDVFDTAIDTEVADWLRARAWRIRNGEL